MKKKWIELMKLSVFMFIVFLTQVQARAWSQNEILIIKEDKITLSELLWQIQKKTDFVFAYSNEDVDDIIKTNLHIKGKLDDLLNEILKETNLTFTREHQIYVLKRKPNTSTFNQEKITVKGKVTNKEGVPIPGVSIRIDGSTSGTATDFQGDYEISIIDLPTSIIFSSIGFESQKVLITGKATLNIILKESLSELDEVVVIGYGTQKRENVTGSVVSVDRKQLERVSIANPSFDRGLGGLLKGVNVTQASGQPGSGVDINIRGYTSPLSGGNNQPLFVIDGVPFNTDAQFNTGGGTSLIEQVNPLLVIDVNNIETIDVLKDAAATAIYGSRGANGVIIVTTKRGKRDEKVSVEASVLTSVGKPINLLKPMNRNQYLKFTDLIFKNSVHAANNGQLPSYRLLGLTDGNMANLAYNPDSDTFEYHGLNQDFFGSENINWFDHVYRSNAITHQYNINARGGSEKVSFSLGGSVMDQEGVEINNDFKQYNFFANIDTDLSKSIRVGSSINLGHSITRRGNYTAGSQTSSISIESRPDLPVFNTEGKFQRLPNYDYGYETYFANPLAQLQRKNIAKGFSFIGNVFVEAEIINNLKIKTEFNSGLFFSKYDNFDPEIITGVIIPGFPEPESSLSTGESLNSNMVTNLSASYDLKFNNHSMQFITGYAWDRTNIRRSSYYYIGFPDNDILTNASNARELISFGDGETETGLNSVFARAIWNFKNRYSATLNFRSDTSSKFGPNNQRGYFPSLSVGWNLHNERFMESASKTINKLKLRLSGGRTGSANVYDFAYLQFFQRGAGDIGQYNGNMAIGFTSSLPNIDIGWETTDELNFGLEFSLLKNRVYGNIDLYSRWTDGALALAPLPKELGVESYTSNLMSLKNRGLEIELGGDILRSKDGVNWSVAINWAFNRGKIVDFNGANISSYFQDNFIEGYPVGTIKGYKVEGIFQTQQEIDELNQNAATIYGAGARYDRRGTAPGDYKFSDLNNDGRITVDDRVVIGDIEPDFFGGISNTMSYKNFELSTIFQFSVGAQSLWTNQNIGTFGLPGANSLAMYSDNTWTPENTSAEFHRIVYADPGGNRRTNDTDLYDTSYLRLKNLYLRYTLPSRVSSNIGLTAFSLFVSASNIFTITNWPGVDPETINADYLPFKTRNLDPYPLAKSVSLGVNLQF